MVNYLYPDLEWEILNFELRYKKLKRPIDKNEVKRRELLLMAQVLLADYSFIDDKKEKEFYATTYKKTMDLYFNWNV